MAATSWFGTPVGAVGKAGSRLAVAPSCDGHGGISAANGAKGDGCGLSAGGFFPSPLLVFLPLALLFPPFPFVRLLGLNDLDWDLD